MARIKLKNIHKTYQVDGRAFPVLNGIDLEIPAGKITVILGQSGCGKTTLLRLTGGLESADSGEVLWDGAHKTAFVFQEPRLMPWLNVWNNIIFGLKKNQVDQEKIQDIVSTVNLSGFEKAYPSQLSGGMQQRAAIARALAMEPEVLLFDEPTSALDPISTSKIEDLAMELKKDYTIVMVTHNMQQAARISDNTAFFLLGEVVEYDKTEKLFSMPKDRRTEDYITGRFG